MQDARADEQEKIEDLRAQVIQKEREMEEDKAKGIPSSQYVNNCRANEAMVTPEIVKMINKILENDSPEALCEALEVFVGLLRNKPRSTPADVELFFADAAKLVSKMSKTKTTAVDLKIVDDALEKLERISRAFGVDQEDQVYDLSFFDSFVQWSQNYCFAAQIDLRQRTMQNEIDQMKVDIERAELAAASYVDIQRQIEANNMQNYYEMEIQSLERRIEDVEAIVQIDRGQAEVY